MKWDVGQAGNCTAYINTKANKRHGQRERERANEREREVGSEHTAQVIQKTYERNGFSAVNISVFRMSDNWNTQATESS